MSLGDALTSLIRAHKFDAGTLTFKEREELVEAEINKMIAAAILEVEKKRATMIQKMGFAGLRPEDYPNTNS